MSVSIIFPFASMDPRRIDVATWVAHRWATYFPTFEVVICKAFDGEGQFQRGEARDNGVRLARGDVIILADADTTFPDKLTVWSMLADLEQGARWALQTGYFNLTREYSEQLMNAADDGQPIRVREGQFEHALEQSPSGLIAMRRRDFIGYDPRFRGWGYEDNAFAMAMTSIHGPPVRDGYCVHLWHDRSEAENFGQPNIGANRALYQRYADAVNRPAEMLKILEER